MTKRTAIPADIVRQVLIESGHRCAVCGDPCPLERSHIIPFRESHEHTIDNLICLCANCHELADKENWGQKILSEYKRLPWVRRAFEQRSHEDAVRSKVQVTIDLETVDVKDERNRSLLRHALAAFLNIPPGAVRIKSVEEG